MSTSCIDGQLYRHDPQHDDPDLETNMGVCPECDGLGCELAAKRERLDKFTPGWRGMKHQNGLPIFAADGTMLDDRGNRSIFDDVDE